MKVTENLEQSSWYFAFQELCTYNTHHATLFVGSYYF